jgi:hypothetical protein
MEDNGQDTWEKFPHHEVFKEEKWPKSVMTGLEDGRMNLHVEDLYLEPRREGIRPLGNMSISEEGLKVKYKDDGDNFGKDGLVCH